PRRLLLYLDVRHAVLGEKTLVLGDEQRAGIGERDEAELGLGRFRTAGGGTVHAGEKTRVRGGEQRGGASARFEEAAPARPGLGLDRHGSSFLIPLIHSAPARASLPVADKKAASRGWRLAPGQRRCCSAHHWTTRCRCGGTR